MIGENTEGRHELQYVGWTRENEWQRQMIAYTNKRRHYHELTSIDITVNYQHFRNKRKEDQIWDIQGNSDGEVAMSTVEKIT